jgi:uncharacterized SAM-binding protein YcdF (DUF218 family)
MFVLSKILPELILPVGGTLLLLATAMFRRSWTIVLGTWFLLSLASTPWTGNRLMQAMEVGMERVSAPMAERAEAIVVLSTGRTVAPGPEKISEWHDADRFFGGIELFRAGKAPMLIFTGGSAPWERSAPLEGEILAGHARSMGIPAEAIRVTRQAYNTREEAAAVRELLPAHPSKKSAILLVTSAMHMPRAQKVFEQAGFQVLPFPVDFITSATRKAYPTDFVPSAAGLFKTSAALRELYGRIFVAIFR